MIVIDKRGIPLTHTFDELAIGKCFQDVNDKLCMKIDYGAKIVYNSMTKSWIPTMVEEMDELVIPLKTTITVERES